MDTSARAVRAHRVRGIATAVLLGLALSACSGFEEDPAAPSAEGSKGGEGGGTFSVAVGIDPDTLDPAGQTTTTVQNMVDYVVETLLRVDDKGEVVPALATSVETSEDGLTVDVELEQDVVFHDGKPFNAEAVVFNLERIIDPELTVPLGSPFEVMKEITAVDEDTVQITLNAPSPGFRSALSVTTAGMISPASIDAEGNTNEDYQKPVGTGPFAFEEYTAGENVTVTKFADYWGEKPYYDEVVFRIVPEAATRESLLLAGQVDMIILPPVSDLKALEENDEVEVKVAPSDRTIFIALNTNDEQLDDPRVRQALNHAVDKQAIIDNVLFGAAEQMTAPMAKSLFGYCETGTYEYDPERAKQLLQEAGASGMTLDLLTPSGRYVQDQQAAEAVAGYLREIGLKVKVTTSDFPSFLARVNAPPSAKTVDMHLLGWAPPYLDAEFAMQMFRKKTHPPAGLATSFYTNPEVEKYLTQADTETDEDAREQAYCEASKIIWEDAPWIFLWTQSFPIVHSADVTGIGFTPTEKFSAIYARPVD